MANEDTNVVTLTLLSRCRQKDEWTESNIVLAEGELGFESDTLNYKIGTGVSPWNDLNYVSSDYAKRLYEFVKIGNADFDGRQNLTAADIGFVPATGGKYTGFVELNADPEEDLQAATKHYVDETLRTFDSMILKGTLGTNGTVTDLPVTDIIRGDTYKIITAGTWAGIEGCRVGDMIVAMASGDLEPTDANWLLIPSGDETETFIKYSTNPEDVNLTTENQCGNLILAEAAIHQVTDLTEEALLEGNTSTNLITERAFLLHLSHGRYLRADVEADIDVPYTFNNMVYINEEMQFGSSERYYINYNGQGHFLDVYADNFYGIASYATRLHNTRYINGVPFDGRFDIENIVHICTCSTNNSNQVKELSCDTIHVDNFPQNGNKIALVYTTGVNTSTEPKFCINGGDEYPVMYKGNAITPAYINNTYIFEFMFIDNTWVMLGTYDTNTTYTLASLGSGYGQCNSSATNLTKSVTVAGFNLITGGTPIIRFSNRVPANSTLNISDTGDKPIYYKGSPIVENIIKDGCVAQFIYDGNNYEIVSVNNVPGHVDELIISEKVMLSYNETTESLDITFL